MSSNKKVRMKRTLIGNKKARVERAYKNYF